ncbi:glycosyl transferase family 2 [Fontibacillus phaseoli]|uniref:Glycosyl transferase family 2 n=1 Tax=Fontibacillus phaseoli TaxID=1416533 RepID=A0A369BPA4_9BACL|nr:glycosyltransferase [Fontibacillus phaseoli]RCX22468.1 glycosyl transferase family 2 [Fontibacillus phaseoli]
MPRASIIMPVYNNADFVLEAVNSMLGQTYRDFELILIDDGSTDGSASLISRITDYRVRRIYHEKNQGLVSTLNEGFGLATGDYIVRMDSDDISTPNRLELQVSFMDQNPDIGLSAAAFTSSSAGRPKVNPANHEEIKTWLLFHCCLCHPLVIMRNSLVQRLGVRYDSNYPHAEDYELWNRLAFETKVANLPANLLFYRQHSGQVSHLHKAIQDDSARRIRQRQFNKLGLELSAEEYQTMLDFVFFRINQWDQHSYTRALGFANWVLEQNAKHRVYDQQMLNLVFSRCISNLPY